MEVSQPQTVLEVLSRRPKTPPDVRATRKAAQAEWMRNVLGDLRLECNDRLQTARKKEGFAPMNDAVQLPAQLPQFQAVRGGILDMMGGDTSDSKTLNRRPGKLVGKDKGSTPGRGRTVSLECVTSDLEGQRSKGNTPKNPMWDEKGGLSRKPTIGATTPSRAGTIDEGSEAGELGGGCVVRAPSKAKAFSIWDASIGETEEGEPGKGCSDEMWVQYLRYFSADVLNWLASEFDRHLAEHRAMLKDMSVRLAPISQCVMIAEDYLKDHYDCEEPREGSSLISEGIIQDGIVSLFDGPDREVMKFDELIRFVNFCEMRVLEEDSRAGFSDVNALRMKKIFQNSARDLVNPPKGSKTVRRMTSLSVSQASFTAATERRVSAPPTSDAEVVTTLFERAEGPTIPNQSIFGLMGELGFDAMYQQDQKNIVAIVKFIDRDKNGVLDYREVLDLARKLELLKAQKARFREFTLIKASSFNAEELSQFWHLFEFFHGEGGIFGLKEIEFLLENIDIKMDNPQKRQLAGIVKAILGTEANPHEDAISFGEFLNVLRRLMDENFCNIQTITQGLVQDAEREARYLSAEDIEAKEKDSLMGRMADQTGESAGASWFSSMMQRSASKDRYRRQASKESLFSGGARQGSKDLRAPSKMSGTRTPTMRTPKRSITINSNAD